MENFTYQDTRAAQWAQENIEGYAETDEIEVSWEVFEGVAYITVEINGEIMVEGKEHAYLGDGMSVEEAKNMLTSWGIDILNYGYAYGWDT